MRLIDADALLDKFEWKVTSPLYIRIIRTMIKAAPTIYAVQHTDDVIQKMQDIEQAQIHKAYDLGYAEGKADTEPQWIPCGEQLPKKKGRYWVWAEKYFIPDHVDEPGKYTGSTEASFIDGRWYGRDLGKVFAWMPLPEPYKEKTEE